MDGWFDTLAYSRFDSLRDSISKFIEERDVVEDVRDILRW